jgi:ABC-type multidrug transport system fused ATPase/permease subunit
MVGENGALLSGGQKQRLTIARALLKNPEILILDEATSSLDMESEQMIKMAIDGLRARKTLFIVSHRPSMLENVDRILAIQDGQVKEINPQKYDAYKQSQFLV